VESLDSGPSSGQVSLRKYEKRLQVSFRHVYKQPRRTRLWKENMKKKVALRMDYSCFDTLAVFGSQMLKIH
jgi:hypothetical protein